MGRRTTLTTVLIALLLAEAADHHRRSVRGWVANTAAQAVDVNSVIDAVDVDAIAERIDINDLVSRLDVDEVVERIDLNALLAGVDIDAVVARIDLNDLASRIDVDALVSRLDIDGLVARLDVDALVARIDVNSVLDRIDPNLLLDRVEPDRLLDRVDPDRLLDRVDPDRLLNRVDPNLLLDRVEPDRLLDRVDPDRLLDRVDLNAAADRIDMDRIIDRVDVAAVIERAGVPDIVRESTGHMAGSVLDVARRQIVALDQVLMRLSGRLIRRKPEDFELGPPRLLTDEATGKSGRGIVTGHYAGPLSRLLAFSLDVAIIFGLFTLFAALLVFLGEKLFGWTGTLSPQQTVVGFVMLCSWAFMYSVGTLVIAARTVGKGVLGLRVVSRDGGPIGAGQSVVRVVVTPFAVVTFVFSYIGLFFGKERRALTDVAAGTVVVYDWGDRSADMPAPMTRWLERQAELRDD